MLQYFPYSSIILLGSDKPSIIGRRNNMAKTNKELAVELYSAFLISSGNTFSSPNFTGTIRFPSNDEMVEQINELTTKLSRIEDK